LTEGVVAKARRASIAGQLAPGRGVSAGMRPSAIAVLAAALCVLSAASTASAKAFPCSVARRHRVLLKTPAGIVVVQRHVKREQYLFHYTDTYSACLNSAGRWVVLGRGSSDGLAHEETEAGGEGLLSTFRLSGPYVTFLSLSGDKYATVDQKVEQFDLRTGRRTLVADYRYGLEVALQDPLNGQSPSSLVTAPNGDAAWFISGSETGVVVHDASGTRIVAGYTHDRNPSNLRITEREITWTDRDEDHSAPLL